MLEGQKHARIDALGRFVRSWLAKREGFKSFLTHNPIIRVYPDRPVIPMYSRHGYYPGAMLRPSAERLGD